MLQINQVRRVLSQTLSKQVVRVLIVGLLGGALRVLEDRLQTLPNGGRNERQTWPIRAA